jgi:7-carboxy-7-deazaguanine synthase
MAEPRPDKKIPLVEAFGPTVQGEGYMVGVRTSFLRFGLCDYECKMCDSMHAVDPQQVSANAEWLTQFEIAEKLLELHDPNKDFVLNCEWVTFSGGNPCIHNLEELVRRIKGFDITHGVLKIAVETQGTFLPAWLHLCDVVTVSPKSPGMGEKFEADKFARFVMTFQHHIGFNVKVVLFSQQDIEFLKMVNGIVMDIAPHLRDRVYASLGNPYPPGQVPDHLTDDDLKLELLQSYRILTEEMLQERDLMNVKFLPQLHVLAWANKQAV